MPSLAAALVGAALLAIVTVAGAGASARAKREVTFYTLATGVQFINTADDRHRGVINNPFDPKTDRLRPNTNEVGNGPFPGDVAVYSFDLYTSRTLKRHAGSASFTCYFNYAGHALCQAYYELQDGTGTLVASGPVNFNETSFRLVVTGGTKRYLAARGEVTGVPAAHNSQRVSMQLL